MKEEKEKKKGEGEAEAEAEESAQGANPQRQHPDAARHG